MLSWDDYNDEAKPEPVRNLQAQQALQNDDGAHMTVQEPVHVAQPALQQQATPQPQPQVQVQAQTPPAPRVPTPPPAMSTDATPPT